MTKDAVKETLDGLRTFAVVQGDAVEVMRGIRDGVDHVFTDPPYELEAHTKQRRMKTKVKRRGGPRNVEARPLSFEAITDEGRALAGAEFARLARRWVGVFCQVEAAMKWSAALAPLLTTKRVGVWVKPDAMPQLTGDRPGMGYESIVFAHPKGRSRWNGGGRVGVFVHNKGHGARKSLHETEKPVALMMELISLFTNPGDIVLDPFAGSASTGVACLRLGRRFVGVERDPKVAKLARERLEAEFFGLDVEAYRREQLPLFPGAAR